ncbi:MAG: PIN domain-containing protein [Betaproteobacteria bacterium]|nr:PIN domain-containing protein [Betaproteobacteria bacterium]
MVGIDTNVLVRYLTQDDPKQSAVATRFIEGRLSTENPGFVSTITLCEIAWVLAESYGADRKRIRQIIEGLLATKQLVIERSELVWKSLRAWEGVPADFSDALIGQLAIAHGAEKTVTFDRTATKLPGFELLA